jgi:hypothetical protein
MNADGSLDTAFNPTGGMNTTVDAIAIDSSGKPYVGAVSPQSTAQLATRSPE